LAASAETICGKLTSNMSHLDWGEWVSPHVPYIALCPGLPISPDGK
jgi:hypothetical protein